VSSTLDTPTSSVLFSNYIFMGIERVTNFDEITHAINSKSKRIPEMSRFGCVLYFPNTIFDKCT
jgi:hypothetical protein